MTDDKKGNDKRCKCSQKAYGSLVPLDEAKRFIKDCMTTVGASEDNAVLVANLLTEADDRGLYSHGMNRLGFSLAQSNQMKRLTANDFRVLRE